MSGWLLNIVGMIFLGVMIEIILPSGKTSVIIKSTFAIFLLYVIVSPLPTFFSGGLNIGNNNNNNSFVTDSNYLINVNMRKVTALEEAAQNALHAQGFRHVKVVISANVFTSPITIHNVHVDLINLVLNNVGSHININEQITRIVASIINVREGGIILHGR